MASYRVAAEPLHQQGFQSLQESRMKSLHLQADAHGIVIPSEEATDWLSQLGWNEILLAADKIDNSVAARTMDALLEMLPTFDHIRRNWM
jgi:hypothetical protein